MIVKKHRLSLQALARKFGPLPTYNQQRDIALKRSRLQERVDTFQKQAVKLLNTVSSSEDDAWDDFSAREIYTGVEFDGVCEGEDDDEHVLSAKAAEDCQKQLSAYTPDSCIDCRAHLIASSLASGTQLVQYKCRRRSGNSRTTFEGGPA
jgi:hypothetical protein